MQSGLKLRQNIVFGLLTAFALVLAGRLVYLQVFQHPWLAQLAQSEHARDETIPARRGDIYDAEGNLLAANQAVDAVYAARTQVEDPPHTATVLSALLHVDPATLLARMTDQRFRFVRLAAWVTPDVSQQVQNTKLPGIFLEPTTRRIYPQGTLAADVLGFTNDDGTGQYGLEQAYNTQLAGQPGHLKADVDVGGRPINFTVPREAIPATDGADLVTTIDADLQWSAQQALDAAVKQHRATGGTILIMDPRTGSILADANDPTYDPNQFATTNPGLFVNPSVSEAYEPGSTFKIVTMAIALQQHVVTPSMTVPDSGSLALGGIHISNWNDRGHAAETMTRVLQFSSNVGAAQVAWWVGAPRYYPLLRQFGFGRPTGVDLAGEVSGTVNEPDGTGWTPATLVTNAFGQGLAVTPLQLVDAVAAVADDGLLMKPRVVSAVRDANGTHVIAPTVLRRVLDSATASTLSQMLATSAKAGEAQLAVVPGFDVAAKTGTAQVASPQGGYAPGKFIASLVGFAPATNPRFVMLVKVDQPQDVPYGSEVAAPVWRQMAEQLFVHLAVPPVNAQHFSQFQQTSRPVGDPTARAMAQP